MLFNSHIFIFAFLPLTLLLFYAAARRSAYLALSVLVLASLIFYAWDSPLEHFVVLVASISMNFVFGRAIIQAYESQRPARRRVLLAAGIAANLCVLGFYKYTGFLFNTIGIPSPFADIYLPLGISFFTFTQIAYLVDASCGRAKEYSPIHYVLFVTYFPHLIAGPILHHREMMPQFANRRIFTFRAENLSIGLSIFVIGLAKKLLLADPVAPLADAAFNATANGIALTIAEAWLGALAYAMQIYFDFSAYSDMAIGISRIFGIRLPVNFASPYKAASIVEFWRRWHMTLSRFLRDYLYIPLGGNRHGLTRRYLNLIITMLLGGLWHGAAWTFVIWGGLHGIYLCINHAWSHFGAKFGYALPRALSVCITFIAVVIAWVFFRAESAMHANAMLHAMLGLNGISLPTTVLRILGEHVGDGPVAQLLGLQFDGMFHNGIYEYPGELLTGIGVLLAIVWFLPNTAQLFARYRPALMPWRDAATKLVWRPTLAWSVYGAVLFVAAIFAISQDSPFLYFRF